MTQVVFHIGLRKTATTYLQAKIFPKFESVTYLRQTENLLSKALITSNKTVLISDEGLSGSPYSRKKVRMSFPEQFNSSIQKLNELFRNPKIIVCFREPASFIHSNYKQFLHEGGTLTWSQFFALDNSGLVKTDDLMFSQFANILLDYMPNGNLFVYDFDDFKNNPISIIQDLHQFITGTKMPDDLDFSKSISNPAVPDDLEGFLISLNGMNNKLFKKYKMRLKLNLFGKIINPRVLCQYAIPKLYKFKNHRNLNDIKAFYNEDWLKTKRLINNINNPVKQISSESKR